MRPWRILTPVVLLAVAALPAAAQQAPTVTAPDVVPAGSSYQVTVTAPATDTEGTLMVTSGAGMRFFSLDLSSGSATVTIPAPAVTVAGRTEIAASVDGATATTTLEVAAEPRPAAVFSNVAPERMHVDDGRPLTVVALLSDRFGNPLPGKAAVTLRRPDGTTVTTTQESDRGLVVSHLAAGEVPGSGEVSVGIDGVTSANPVVLLPGVPAPFDLAVRGSIPPADGLSRVEIGTGDLVDGAGNTVEDGTAVTVVVSHQDGSSDQIETQVVAHRITLTLRSPASPDRLRVVAYLLGVESSPLTLDFGGGR